MISTTFGFRGFTCEFDRFMGWGRDEARVVGLASGVFCLVYSATYLQESISADMGRVGRGIVVVVPCVELRVPLCRQLGRGDYVCCLCRVGIPTTLMA